MITNVSGNFKEFEAAVESEAEDFTTARVTARIRTASINTNNLQREEHLLSADFFQTETYPDILFASTKVERVDEERFLLQGNLTLKGVTRPVKLQAEYRVV
jgi:polyisoprenoid-binding protein YceI